MTVPGWVIVMPPDGRSATPAGTPVFDASGHAEDVGCGVRCGVGDAGGAAAVVGGRVVVVVGFVDGDGAVVVGAASRAAVVVVCGAVVVGELDARSVG
jgi:hypothetical protein